MHSTGFNFQQPPRSSFGFDERRRGPSSAPQRKHNFTVQADQFDHFLSTPDDYSRSLFVGDISIFCDETNLHELFSAFGAVETIQLKKPESDSTKSHLSYGFIKFRFRESAEAALKRVDGVLFLGRNIRVGWAVDHPSKKSPFDRSLENRRCKPTAQIHVTFTSRHPNSLVTEVSLRNVFGQFGEVVDVTIKKTVFNKDVGSQSGYGFIHYHLNEFGVVSALEAVQVMHGATFEFVTYECTVSHGLRNYLLNHPKLNLPIRGVNQRTISSSAAVPIHAFPQQMQEIPRAATPRTRLHKASPDFMVQKTFDSLPPGVAASDFDHQCNFRPSRSTNLSLFCSGEPRHLSYLEQKNGISPGSSSFGSVDLPKAGNNDEMFPLLSENTYNNLFVMPTGPPSSASHAFLKTNTPRTILSSSSPYGLEQKPFF